MRNAQIRKMASQHMGSILEVMSETVAKAMASPKRERPKISFQFMQYLFRYFKTNESFQYRRAKLVKGRNLLEGATAISKNGEKA